MTTVVQAHTRRIVAVFGTGGDASVAGLLSSLVSDRSASVTGVFLEDHTLFRLAELPFTMEVCRVTTTRRHLTSRELERQMRVLAARAEQSVRRVAEGVGSSWTFRKHRGRLSSALAEGLEGDLLLIGTSRGALASAGERRLTTHFAESETRRPVAVLLDPPAVSDRALDAAIDLAARTGRRLVAFVPGADLASSSEVLDHVRRLGPKGSAVRNVPDPSPEALLSAVRRAEPVVLVVAAGESGFDETRIGSLQRQLRCPMIMVR